MELIIILAVMLVTALLAGGEAVPSNGVVGGKDQP